MVELTFASPERGRCELAELRGAPRLVAGKTAGSGSRRVDVHPGDGGAARGRATRARRGLAHRRLAADRNRARSAATRDGVSGRGRPATAPRRARRGGARERARCAVAPARGVLLGVKRTALAPDELVTAVRLAPSGGAQTCMKVGPRNAMVIAVCSLAVVVDTEAARCARRSDRRGHRKTGRRALPRRGSCRTGVAEAAAPIDDVRATAAYRRHALRVTLAGRALERAFAQRISLDRQRRASRGRRTRGREPHRVPSRHARAARLEERCRAGECALVSGSWTASSSARASSAGQVDGHES